MIGYVAGGELRWLDLAQAANQAFKLHTPPNSIHARFQCADPDGGRWEIEQRFSPGAIPGTIAIETQVKVDQRPLGCVSADVNALSRRGDIRRNERAGAFRRFGISGQRAEQFGGGRYRPGGASGRSPTA